MRVSMARRGGPQTGPRLPTKAGGSLPWDSGENLFPTGVITVLVEYTNEAESRQIATKTNKEERG
jgi:hypothetical protein